MHDIDRIQRELEQEHEQEYEQEQEGEARLGALFGEAEYEGEQEQEMEMEQEQEQELEMEFSHEAESPLSEAQEMELASELLEVSNDAELEYFFGKLFRAAGRGLRSVGRGIGRAARNIKRGVRHFARTPQGRILGGMLKRTVKQALPVVGSFGGPIGTALGTGLASTFELELEGLSHEDREFEVARQLVRLGAAAAHRASHAPRHTSPRAVARHAFKAAARTYAPGLVHGHRHCRNCGGRRGEGRGDGRGRRYQRASGDPTFGQRIGGIDGANGAFEPGDGGSGGRWYRRGQQIVLTGV